MRIGGSASFAFRSPAPAPPAGEGGRSPVRGDAAAPTSPSPLADDGPGSGARETEDPRVAGATRARAQGTQELSEEQLEQVRELEHRDAEVRAHEAAHASAAGSAGGGVHLEYERGPDGRSYAVGGDVPVRLEPGRTPEETARNARQIRAAALAPASPSSQDRAVAAQAASMEAAAMAELASPPREPRSGGGAGATDLAQAPRGADASLPPVDSERELVPLQVARERQVAYGERGHLHADSNCGPCGRAVARYS